MNHECIVLALPTQLAALIWLRLSKFPFAMHTFPIKHGNAHILGRTSNAELTIASKHPMIELLQCDSH